MPSAPGPIIRKLTCEEHRCKIFEDLRILERLSTGELRLEIDSLTPKKEPWRDYNGKLLTHNENGRILDDSFPSSDPRHVAVKTHRHIAEDGTPGASEKYDPKSITTPDGIRHQPLPSPNSECELCQSGDMIPPWKRHHESKYRLSTWLRYLGSWFRGIIGA